MDDLQLISIGDASLDVFIHPVESESLCEIDTKKCFIAFSYGDKIPVDQIHFSVGGNAANNAVGAVRLGVKTAPIITLGDDGVARQIKDTLEKEGVDTRFVTIQEKTMSNYSTAVVYSGERTIFTYKGPDRYAIPEKLPAVEWVYLTSMADTFRSFYDEFVLWIREHKDTKLAYNPGSRQLRAPKEEIKDILGVTYMLYVNRSEAEHIAGMQYTQGKEKELLIALSALGPRLAVVTDGSNGAYVYEAVTRKFLRSGVFPVDAYERTGAGDAFGSGCISGLIKKKSIEEALLWGTLNSASVIGYTGSQRGLLKEEEMSEWLEKAKSSGVEVREF